MTIRGYMRLNTREDILTAADDAVEQVKTLRARLAKFSTSDEWSKNNTENLLSALHDVVTAEAEAYVLRAAATYLSHESKPTGAEVWDELVREIALNPVDDAWSGRGNDLKRVRHAASIEAVKDLKFSLKHL